MTKKMVLDTSLLNTQHYKVRIKGKVEKSWERSSALLLYLSVVAIEKGAFRSPSTTVTKFTYFLIMDIWWQAFYLPANDLVSYGCCIHWLRLCSGVRLPQIFFYLWHKTDGKAPVMTENFGNAEYPFIAIAPRSTQAPSGSPWLGPIYGSNRTKPYSYAKLNYLK